MGVLNMIIAFDDCEVVVVSTSGLLSLQRVIQTTLADIICRGMCAAARNIMHASFSVGRYCRIISIEG